MSQHPPTEEQAAILDAVTSPYGSVMCEAGAGCAKTTTLEMSSSRVRVPALAIAFNKRIVTEMGNRLPGNFAFKTMNSLGHGSWGRKLGRNLKLDDRKVGKLVTQAAKERLMDLSSDQWDAARGLIREAQIQGLVPQAFDPDSTQTLVPDTREGWQSLLSSRSAPDIDQADFDFIWELSREALTYNINLALDGIISYDDQIYCSTMLGGQFARFPFIFLDEDQDLNPLQIRMVSQSMRQDTRLLAVGDRHQSIYAFRGAVGEAAEQLKTLRPEWTDLPLMTSFRVPQLIAIRQRDHVPAFRAHGTNPNGMLYNWMGHEQGWSWRDVLDALPDQSVETAILCRNNAPILSLAFKLIRQNIGCYILGRDLSKGLVILSKKIAPDDSTSSEVLRGRIEEWELSELSKARANDRPEMAERITDKAECLLAVIFGSECHNAGQLRRALALLFNRESGLVCLSSIHRAKGLEWPAVIHLDPWRIPSRWAKGDPQAMEQEMNLRYVAETRTKHTLILANIEDFH